MLDLSDLRREFAADPSVDEALAYVLQVAYRKGL